MTSRAFVMIGGFKCSRLPDAAYENKAHKCLVTRYTLGNNVIAQQRHPDITGLNRSASNTCWLVMDGQLVLFVDRDGVDNQTYYILNHPDQDSLIEQPQATHMHASFVRPRKTDDAVDAAARQVKRRRARTASKKKK